MKTHILLLATLFLVTGMALVSAKNHRGKHRAKKAAVTPRSSDAFSAEQYNDRPILPHEITNKKPRPDARKKGKEQKNKNHQTMIGASSGTAKKREDLSTSTTDTGGIPMEQEQLIHVTPVTMKQNKKPSLTQKKQDKRNRLRNKAKRNESQISKKGKKLKKPNNKKYPKKFNAKVHGWKKMQKKEKTEKLKEKREKQLKRLQALKNAKSGQRKA